MPERDPWLHVEKLEGDWLDELLMNLVFVSTAESKEVNFGMEQQGHALGYVHHPVYKWEQPTTVKSCLISSFPCIFNKILQCSDCYLTRNIVLVHIAFYGVDRIKFVLTLL
jgi:hypothetical protein